MDDNTLRQIRDSLSNHHTSLLDWLQRDSPQKQIQLGGSTVKEVLNIISDIQDTLERIDNNKFGKCNECDGEIEAECLELDFTTEICLDHYSPDQLHMLEKDLELTAKVQKHLYPCCIPSLPNIEIAVHTESARIVSGDYYDFFGYAAGAQGIAVADVMGKGLPASILMSNLQASLRILGPEYENLDALAAHLNKLFLHNLKLIRFITIFLAKIDIESFTLQYCNAGHHPVLWWEESSGLVHWLNPTGPAIGLIKDAKYDMKEIQLCSGDMFLFYTDGLVEARNAENEEFGEDRLIRYLKDNHHHTAENFKKRLMDDVKSYAAKFHDDVTLLVAKIK